MKKHINFVKRALALGLVAVTLATTPNLTAFAENNNGTTETVSTGTTSDTLDLAKSNRSGGGFDPEFIPFRSSYASYLASFSSVDSENVRKIWEKLFWEENNWDSSHPDFYDAKYSKWSDKYYCSYLFAGEEKSSKGIRYSELPGDFEGFFGNAVKNNKTFLGELLGLPGYEKPSEANTEVNELMTSLVCSYLKNPAKYPVFAKKVVELTADGSYIGKNKTDIENELASGSYNGTSFDIYLLTTLAYFYEGDGDENDLSPDQVTWLKSYQEYLFNDYVTKSSRPASGALPTDKKSLAATYRPIYELLVMSTDAANSTSSIHPAQEFFDYAEKNPSMNAGAFLNLVNDVKKQEINGLNDVKSIATLFTMTNGFCAGHMENDSSHPCANKANCKFSNQGGFASKNDEIAYYLHITSAAMDFVKGNSTVYTAYTNPSDKDGGWLEKFNGKHPDKANPKPPTYVDTADIVTSGNHDGNRDKDCKSWEGKHLNSYVSGPLYINIGMIDEVHPEQPASRVQKVTFSSWVASGGNFNNSSWSYTINGVDASSSGKISRSGNTFDIHKLSLEERKTAIIKVNLSASQSYYINPYGWGDGHAHEDCGDVQAKVRTSPTAVLDIKYAKCNETLHMWQTSLNNVKFDTVNNTATVRYDCANDLKHTVPNVVENIVSKEYEDYIEYTFTSSYAYKLKQDKTTGEWEFYRDAQGNLVPESYTTRVYKTPGKSTDYIPFGSTNTAGTLSDYNIGTEVIYPAGSKSKETYKASDTVVTMITSPDLIYPGAKSITLNYSYTEELTYLSMILYSSTGEIIATNDLGNNKIYLTGLGDSMLDGCCLKVSVKAHTQNWTYNYAWIGGAKPTDAYSKVSITGMTVEY